MNPIVRCILSNALRRSKDIDDRSTCTPTAKELRECLDLVSYSYITLHYETMKEMDEEILSQWLRDISINEKIRKAIESKAYEQIDVLIDEIGYRNLVLEMEKGDEEACDGIAYDSIELRDIEIEKEVIAFANKRRIKLKRELKELNSYLYDLCEK